MYDPQLDTESTPQLVEETQNETPDDGAKFSKFLLDLVQMLIITLVLYVLIDAVIGRVQVESISMLETVKPQELLMVAKLAYRNDDFHRGDIVVFHYPNNPNEDYIKRIIGLPGDTVTVQNGEVYINGFRLDEPYIREAPNYNGEWIVPEESLFVLGDNRNQSSDSHDWGFVPFDNVFGRALMIYWPLEELTIFSRLDPVSAATVSP
ncbi:MAG: signal peptidase I [Anaerolineae bacterium]|nr:signal peptidase I [Anaerolineae bacterium]